MRALILVSIGFIFGGMASAVACPQDDIRTNARFCFSQTNADWYGDLVIGSCNKDANKTRDAFRSCQGDGGIRDRYDQCNAGEQIDAVRAAGNDMHIYKPGQCGF